MELAAPSDACIRETIEGDLRGSVERYQVYSCKPFPMSVPACMVMTNFPNEICAKTWCNAGLYVAVRALRFGILYEAGNVMRREDFSRVGTDGAGDSCTVKREWGALDCECSYLSTDVRHENKKSPKIGAILRPYRLARCASHKPDVKKGISDPYGIRTRVTGVRGQRPNR